MRRQASRDRASRLVAGFGVDMGRVQLSPRFVELPVSEVLGISVPVASSFRARLLGLAHLGREEAGSGLLIPRCRSVHTFGMRFALDVVFLDESGRELRRTRLAPRRLARDRRAAAVLEIPVAP